jgi:hypothetical protein
MHYLLFLYVWALYFLAVLALIGIVKVNLVLVLSFIVALYEVVVRLIPSVGNYSLIAKIIDILKWLSEFLNRKKK